MLDKSWIIGLHMNIRNMKKNLVNFEIYRKGINRKIDFFVFTETWVNEREAENYGISMEGYNIEFSRRKYNKNGGIAIAVNKDWEYARLEGKDSNREAEELSIKLQGKGKSSNIVIKAIYRNQSRNPKLFIKDVVQSLSDLDKGKENIVAIGDWNIDLNKDNAIARYLKEEMQNIGYKQMINRSTRVTETSETLIDLCYTNIEEEEVTGDVIEEVITDHYITGIAIKKKGKCERDEGKKRKREKKKGKRIYNI